jgi:hypothetical protein
LEVHQEVHPVVLEADSVEVDRVLAGKEQEYQVAVGCLVLDQWDPALADLVWLWEADPSPVHREVPRAERVRAGKRQGVLRESC